MDTLGDFWTFLVVGLKLANLGIWTLGLVQVLRWVGSRLNNDAEEPAEDDWDGTWQTW